MWCALMVLQANPLSRKSWIGLCDWGKIRLGFKTDNRWIVWIEVFVCVFAAEPAQAAGRSHPGRRDLGDAAEGHRV